MVHGTGAVVSPIATLAPVGVLLVPNAWKESLSAAQAAKAMERGIHRARPSAAVTSVPLSDGGDGLLKALQSVESSRRIRVSSTDPLGRLITAPYLLLDSGTAAVEMAAVSGLRLVAEASRRPVDATTSGLGTLILDAVGRGARKILLGIGGSATSDGGAGLAQRLGLALRDIRGRPIPPGSRGLLHLAEVDPSGLDERLKGVRFQVACDVNNPLLGKKGAARVYGPQKGAGPAEVDVIEKGLRNWVAHLEKVSGKRLRSIPGTGAAGGVALPLLAFLPTDLISGADLLIERANLASRMATCEVAFTCEGRLDGQSAMGKLPGKIARLAKQAGIPLFGICGSLGRGWEEVLAMGMTGAFVIAPGPVDLNDSQRHAAAWLSRATEQVFRTYLAGRRYHRHSKKRPKNQASRDPQ